MNHLKNRETIFLSKKFLLIRIFRSNICKPNIHISIGSCRLLFVSITIFSFYYCSKAVAEKYSVCFKNKSCNKICLKEEE